MGWRGKALLVPGRSGAGKTTLVRALVEAGADYYSDEFAVLGSCGRVFPFPRPLRVRGEGDAPAQRISVPAGRVGREALPVGAVLAVGYREGGVWRPRRLARPQAILALLENTVQARSRAAEAVDLIHRSIGEAEALRGTRGEAAAAAARILDRFS